MDPEGKIWSGLTTIEAVLGRLSEAEQQLDECDAPLSGWQLDPIYMGNQRLSRRDLDRVSATRPIGILHASGHILNVNTKALSLAGLLTSGINHPGIPLDDDGLPTGELKGPEVMMSVAGYVGFDRSLTDADAQGLQDLAKLCVRAGVTTVTDLASRLSDETVEMMEKITSAADFPARLVPLKFFIGLSPKDLVARVRKLAKRSTDRLRLGKIKIVADGPIQGFSARMRWPGYYNGAPNGLWYIPLEQLSEIYHLALQVEVQVHTHTNGDQAIDLALEMLGTALMAHPHRDHRFTLQHCQLADRAQFCQMRTLGVCVNLFANHHFYWGNAHYALTVGPDRALRMNACRTALDQCVPMAIHCDAPVTPLGPLFTAWCAVNRRTASGRVQGAAEKITVAEALYAITLGAAYTLQLDHEVGSIEVGKHADFAVLEADPSAVEDARLKDIGVWGTVQGGRVFPVTAL